jgi:hypothetical protein
LSAVLTSELRQALDDLKRATIAERCELADLNAAIAAANVPPHGELARFINQMREVAQLARSVRPW